jgi:hypothetical protein
MGLINIFRYQVYKLLNVKALRRKGLNKLTTELGEFSSQSLQNSLPQKAPRRKG